MPLGSLDSFADRLARLLAYAGMATLCAGAMLAMTVASLALVVPYPRSA